MENRIAFLLAVLALGSSWSASAQEGEVELDPEQSKRARECLAEFKGAADASSRGAAFQRLIALGQPAAALILPWIDHTLQVEEESYFELLEPRIRGAYLEKLESLSDDQVDHVVRARFLWQPYILKGGSHKRFREVYLAPIRRMKQFLLLQAAEIEDPTSSTLPIPSP